MDHGSGCRGGSVILMTDPIPDLITASYDTRIAMVITSALMKYIVRRMRRGVKLSEEKVFTNFAPVVYEVGGEIE